MTTTAFVDVEDITEEWALTQTAITGLLSTARGSKGVFLAMPKGSPLPCVVLRRVAGAPELHVPSDVARISFDCWAKTRPTAKQIGLALVDAIWDLGINGYTAQNGARIVGAQVVLWLWLPDTTSEGSRYVVDAEITVIAS